MNEIKATKKQIGIMEAILSEESAMRAATADFFDAMIKRNEALGVAKKKWWEDVVGKENVETCQHVYDHKTHTVREK